MISAVEQLVRPFQFERDTFSFPNELVWEYRFDRETGATEMRQNNPRPGYAHRCFVLARSARQFHYHAHFEPTLPKAADGVYRGLIHTVVSRSPRRPSIGASRVVIPGYDCLRSFSQACEGLLKAECGGAWQSYVVRSHWRMVFPVSREHQRQMAGQLLEALSTRPAPVIHLFTFPQLTINHAILLFDRTETESEIQFQAYDPNTPSRPTELTFNRAESSFSLPRNHYWAGGKLSVVEVYRGWFY